MFTEILAIVVCVFIFIKLFFSLLGWYSKDGKDEVYRKQLDELWYKLHDQKLFDLAHNFLVRLVLKINRLLKKKKKVFTIFIVSSFLLNFLTIELFIAFAAMRDLVSFVGAIGALLQGALPSFLIALLGTLFDVLSLIVTWFLIKRASNSISLGKIAFHLYLDLIIACVAVSWAMMSTIIVILQFTGTEPLTSMTFAQFLNGLFKMLDSMGTSGLFLNYYFYITIGISASIPTLLYSGIGITLFFLNVLPRRLNIIIRKVTYLVTTDKMPVLSQLGTLCGSVAAMLAALLKILI